jgi:hypothetical protein
MRGFVQPADHGQMPVKSAQGQFPPPSLVIAMEELASTPDAKARNRYASS